MIGASDKMAAWAVLSEIAADTEAIRSDEFDDICDAFPEVFAALHEREQQLKDLQSQLNEAREALTFYADPTTYFAIGFLGDAPAGEFLDDFSEVTWPGGKGFKPGKRARAALGEGAKG